VSPEAKKLLADRGFDPLYGARPLKRIIQQMILDKLALEMIKGRIKEDNKVKVKVKKREIIFDI
jgi:ATP-dependent Clp protease ATP-binding subunit ClpA